MAGSRSSAAYNAVARAKSYWGRLETKPMARTIRLAALAAALALAALAYYLLQPRPPRVKARVVVST